MQNSQAGKSSGGAKLIGRVAVAVEKRFEFLVLAEEGVEDLLGRQRCGHRQVTAGQAFSEAKKIRLHAFVLTRE